MSELLLDIGQGFAVLNEQGSEGVAIVNIKLW